MDMREGERRGGFPAQTRPVSASRLLSKVTTFAEAI
jgi:hypothetical protein